MREDEPESDSGILPLMYRMAHMTDTTSTSPEKMPLTSLDIAEEKRELLKKCLASAFPEAVAEDQIDFDQLKRVLGEWVEPDRERFGLNWPGKASCMKVIQAPSIGTLKPCPQESVDWDTTENLFIEGDNLEVLKLLQKAHFGKVKMIYIDPPYNTGKEFIYPDKYAESLATYLAYTGQKDSDDRRFSTNTDTSGRFHSRWLNMMYPRLYLAKNLLRQDGAIFISIDDNEYENLKALCNQVFGQENHVATLHIKVRYEGKTLVEDMDFQKLTEQVLIYGKSSEIQLNKPTEQYALDKFKYQIVEMGKPKVFSFGGKQVAIFEPGQYKIEEVEPSESGLKEIWASGKILDGNSSGRFFRDYLSGRVQDDGLGVLYKVYGLGEERSGHRYFTGPSRKGATKGKYYQGVPFSVLEGKTSEKSKPIITYYDFADSFGNCRHEGSIDFRDGKKPVKFLTTLINMIRSDKNELFLDFFAGSCSFAHAVQETNLSDAGKRTCISIQLPEKLDENSDYFRNGYRTVAEIGRERLRNIAAQNDEPAITKGPFIDRGFRSFSLSTSCFKIWGGGVDAPDNNSLDGADGAAHRAP